MECYNKFCIYCGENYKCISDEISINDAGMCSECIVIDLDEEILREEKNKILNRLAKEHARWEAEDLL